MKKKLIIRPFEIFSLILFLAFASSCQNNFDLPKSHISYRISEGVNFFDNSAIRLSINQNMEIKVSYFNGEKIQSITADQTDPNDYLIVNGERVQGFRIQRSELSDLDTEFGQGKQLQLIGRTKVPSSHQELEKILTIALYDDFPNTAITQVDYTNLSNELLKVDKIVSSQYLMDRKKVDSSKRSYDFSLFQGCGVDWGLNYSQIKIDSSYSATNFMGVTQASRDPRGGGIPLLDLWAKEMGMAITHISTRPEFVNLPIKTRQDGKVQFAIEELYTNQFDPISIDTGATYSTLRKAVIVHSLDYFDALRTYATLLNAQDVKTFKETPATVPNAYWKTWGYELDFKVSDIYLKVPEFKELGIEMVVLDDGWFSNYGDWEPNTSKDKFPQGRESLAGFVSDMHEDSLKVGVWWCPLIAEPNSEVAQRNPEWWMHQRNGQPYLMKEPESYFLCPDYEPVLKFWEGQIEKLYGLFDLDFVYHDWANLIEVPPCYNPKHKHESPLAPYWNLSTQYHRMYEKAQHIKSGCAVEMCECGRPHDPFKMPYYNITNASDANNKEQVRRRLKVEKALNGSKVYFNPGYILPETKEDWGYDPCEIDECVGMGGYFETYYTTLNLQKKKEWLKWMQVYRKEKIYKGEYLNLYDVAHDSPEFHVTRKGENLYYFAPGPYKGEIELRGLDNVAYTLLDLNSNQTIAIINGTNASVTLEAEKNIILKASRIKE